MKKRIFVSHSYSDRMIAERLINKLLIDTLKIDKYDIFFTSKRETGIRSSKTWREQIKKNIIDCQLFIAIITPSYHKSQMCQAEMGAAWITNKIIYSLYLSPVNVKNFAVVIAERQAENLLIREEIQSFIEQLTDDYNELFEESIINDNLNNGIIKFLKSLRSYLRKNANDLEIEYLGSKNSKQAKPDNFELPVYNTEAIKKKAKNEYSDDFSMQDYIIEGQKEEFEKLIKLINENKFHPDFSTIYNKAINEWDEDYSMIVYTIEEQLKSLRRLGS